MTRRAIPASRPHAVKQAGEDFDVTVDYRNPPSGDLADMARLIEQAAASNYDGVVTSIADFNVLKGALKKVTDKKIALVESKNPHWDDLSAAWHPRPDPSLRSG